MVDHAKYYIEIPAEVVEKNHINTNEDVTATFNNGSITIQGESIGNRNERKSIRTFLLTSIVAGILAFITFHIQNITTVPLSGEQSISQVAIFLSVIFGGAAFFLTLFKQRKNKMVELKWRHILTLTMAVMIILFAFLALFFKLFSNAFIGLKLDSYTTSFLIGLITGMSTYALTSAARDVNFSTITYTLIALLFGGILFSMMTNGSPDWWQHNFSYLGTDQAKNALYFNFTLIFSGLVMLTLIDYLFSSLHATLKHNRRLFFLRLLFSMLAITLAGVGAVPNNPGWTHTVHDQIAQLLVLWVLIMILGIRWFLPHATHEFIVISYTVGALLVVTDLLFKHFNYLSLTGFEILACGLVFFWLILLLLHLRNIALPAAQFNANIVKINHES